MCNNPTTDGPLEWEGHEMVAYVDITPPVLTQAQHVKQLEELKAAIVEEIKRAEKDLADPEFPADVDDEDEKEEIRAETEDHLEGKKLDLEEIDELFTIPLPVEQLSKIYYVGIDSVPASLMVDVVVSAGCPLDTTYPTTFGEGTPAKDLRTAVQRHLRPGGLFYTGGNWPSFHKTLHDGFAPLVDFVKTETIDMTSEYYAARGGTGQPYSVLQRKAAGGRRHTRKRYPKRKSTRKHK